MREDARVLKNWRKINCWAQIITRRSRYGFWSFVLNNWFFFNFLTPAHPHAQSLFLFPIVFGINSFFSCPETVKQKLNIDCFMIKILPWWSFFPDNGVFTTEISSHPSLSRPSHVATTPCRFLQEPCWSPSQVFHLQAHVSHQGRWWSLLCALPAVVLWYV